MVPLNLKIKKFFIRILVYLKLNQAVGLLYRQGISYNIYREEVEQNDDKGCDNTITQRAFNQILSQFIAFAKFIGAIFDPAAQHCQDINYLDDVNPHDDLKMERGDADAKNIDQISVAAGILPFFSDV